MLWLLQPEPAEGVLRRHFTCWREASISIGQSEVGQGVSRIELNRLFKKFNALRNLRRSELVPVIAPGKVKLIRFDILGVAPGYTLVLFPA